MLLATTPIGYVNLLSDIGVDNVYSFTDFIPGTKSISHLGLTEMPIFETTDELFNRYYMAGICANVNNLSTVSEIAYKVFNGEDVVILISDEVNPYIDLDFVHESLYRVFKVRYGLIIFEVYSYEDIEYAVSYCISRQLFDYNGTNTIINDIKLFNLNNLNVGYTPYKKTVVDKVRFTGDINE